MKITLNSLKFIAWRVFIFIIIIIIIIIILLDLEIRSFQRDNVSVFTSTFSFPTSLNSSDAPSRSCFFFSCHEKLNITAGKLDY